MLKIPVALGVLIAITLTLPALAIVIRHDRDDARYVELGGSFPPAATVLPDGSGVLIAPDWVLTAAHVARGVATRSPRVEVAGQERDVIRVLVHPDWREMPHDIALLQLDKPIEGIAPAALYDGDDEVGLVVTFVGRGDTGTGLTGPESMDRKRRGATNRIVDADDDWIFFLFDKGDAATELEGVSGPGDSGGPAFVERDGKLYTLGVSVFADGDGGPGRYGIKEGYTRVSTHRQWIESVLSGKGEAREVALGQKVGRSDGGRKVVRRGPAEGGAPSPAGKRIQDYVAALNSGEFAQMQAFYSDGVTESFRTRRSEDEDRAMFERLREQFGKLEINGMQRDSPDEVRVRASSDRVPMPLQLTFRLVDDRIDGIAMRAGGPDPG